VSKWSKLDTHWEGVSLDTLLAQVESLGYNNHGDPWKEERYWGD
jgi:DMSO/TMAO reductase YedYZ molybdopterin-dependent catalytic subunit